MSTWINLNQMDSTRPFRKVDEVDPLKAFADAQMGSGCLLRLGRGERRDLGLALAVEVGMQR